MAFTLYYNESAPSQQRQVVSDITDYVENIQFASETDINEIPDVTRKDISNNLGLAKFYILVFTWHCIVSLVIITFCHAMMRAVAVCIYRRVLRQKVLKGEDIGMLAPVPTDNEV